MVGGKCECTAGRNRRKSIRAFAESGEALCECLATKAGEQRTADEAAPADRAATVHWQKS
jgi:hypothetical protein